MKAAIKVKRDLFAELGAGVTALAQAGEGKRTLCTHTVAFKPAPKFSARELVCDRATAVQRAVSCG